MPENHPLPRPPPPLPPPPRPPRGMESPDEMRRQRKTTFKVGSGAHMTASAAESNCQKRAIVIFDKHNPLQA